MLHLLFNHVLFIRQLFNYFILHVIILFNVSAFNQHMIRGLDFFLMLNMSKILIGGLVLVLFLACVTTSHIGNVFSIYSHK